MEITNEIATIQQIGNSAHVSDTWRHENIEPSAITINAPKLNEIADSVIIVPRMRGSLCRQELVWF